MNDLAEKALNGLHVARRQVSSRPTLSLSIAGFVAAGVVVAAGGRVGAARAARPLVNWLGLQDTHGADASDIAPGAVMLLALVVLIALWLVTVEVVRRRDIPVAQVWAIAGAWAMPFAIGPPLMDTTVYSYAAFGLLQRQGGDPYVHGPGAVGDLPVVSAIDPGARGTPSGVGPLGTLLQHLAISAAGGRPLGAVIVLRIVGVGAAVLIGRLATQLAGARSARALTMTVLNPLVLLYVISAPHLDGVMVVFVLAALVAGNQRRWSSAVVLAAIAGSVSGQGFIVLPAIVAAHWLDRARAPGWLIVGRDFALAVVTSAAIGLAVPNGFEWVRTVTKQFSGHPPFAVSTGVAKLMAPIVRGASYDDLAAGARITTLTATVCALVYLLATSRQRALERTAGYSLLALAVLAPVTYPWYLLWGLLCIAPTAAGSRRILVLAFSAAACLLVPPGFGPLAANVITAVGLLAVLAATVFALRRRRSPVAAH